jgi:hypothetical protein
MIITRRVEDTTLNVHVDDIQFEKIQRKSRKYKKSSELMKKVCEKAYHIMNYDDDDLELVLSIWFLFMFTVTFASTVYFASIAHFHKIMSMVLLIAIILGGTILYFGIISYFEHRFFNYGYYLAEEALKDLLNENIVLGFRNSNKDVVEIKYIKGIDPDEKLLERHYAYGELGVDELRFWFVSHENIHKTYDFMLITGKQGRLWFDLMNKE